MRLPRLFYSLMLPLALSAFSFPNEVANLFGAGGDAPDPVPASQSAPPAGAGTLRVPDRGDGHFQVDGKIGARRLPFVVDTGATTVALTWDTGRDLGLVSPGDTADASLSTANGAVRGWRVNLDRLEVGPLEVRNVAAVVLPQGALGTNLLGMSFLSRLGHFEIARDTLVMEQ